MWIDCVLNNGLIKCHQEVTSRVIEANVLNHFPEKVQVVWKQAGLDVAAEQVAKNSTEIFMSRKRKETP